MTDEARSVYTFNAYILGDSKNQCSFVEFAPRKGRNNYRISRQNMKYKHPAWSVDNGFPEPSKDADGEYTSVGDFAGIIDNIVILIIRTTYRRYYAGFVNVAKMPENWPHNIGLEGIFSGERRDVINMDAYKLQFVNDAINPFGNCTTEQLQKVKYETGYENGFSRNRILFGAPGTGKSYTINKERKELLGKDNELDYERVTFHPDYSYANFVGTYKPIPCKDSDGKDAITYEYVPGPFMRVFVKALKNGRTNNVKPYLLIIEEINRANVAAVFGDVFQLLDRDKYEVSEYSIQASEDIKKFLAKPENLGGNPEDYQKIRIPDNMFIWATMNSADQGVFPMDTAFKRRWDFKYLGIDESDAEVQGKMVILGTKVSQRVEWNKLRKAINKFLGTQKINEDKQLGPYFIAKRIVDSENGNEIDSKKFIETFKNKVIMYLFEDAAKQKRATLFEGCFQNSSRYSEICKEFDEKGVGIFNSEIQVATESEDLPSTETTKKSAKEGTNERYQSSCGSKRDIPKETCVTY